jgi:ABC-type transport system involved in cytochrome c biogenesis permease subunit
MSTHITEQRSPTPVVADRPSALGVPTLPTPARPVWPLWSLVTGLVVATGLVIFLAVRLASNGRSVPPDPAKKIALPYAGSPVWQSLHSWVVQEDGRKKPFETFARETVRTVTGREKFEGNDPVAVVFSWIMLYDADEGKANDIGKAAGCNWEKHPFILCDHHELRELIYTEAHKTGRIEGDKLSNEERYGKYVAPADLRHCDAVQKLLEQARERRQREGNKAKLPLVESKAEEVTRRLKLYDFAGAGGTIEEPRPGTFNLVELDRYSQTWFSLSTVRLLAGLDPDKGREEWRNMIEKRRELHPDDYDGKLEQSFPAADVKKVRAAYENVRTAYRSKDEGQFTAASTNFLDTLAAVSREYHPDYPGTTTVARELWYNRVNPFRKAWIVGVLAMFLLGLSVLVAARWALVGKVFYWCGLAAYLGALTCAGVGFFCRVTISGRPPVSDMYESIIWVAFMTTVFGLILELIYRKGVIALAGAVVSTLGFVLADQLPLTFEPNIKPLQAVLRSQYWLIIHVLTIVSSYAAFALAWGLGNFNMATILLAPQRRDLIKTMSLFSYRAIQIGAIMLFAGTMLGGAWAAESWGRFWGWDPKEVWALTAFIIYMIPLHARYVGWIKDFGLAAVSVCCFAAVVMAWYGVNYILGAGLHSYGFGEGSNSWLYMAGLINLDLVFLASLSYLYGEQFRAWRSRTVGTSAAPAAGA